MIIATTRVVGDDAAGTEAVEAAILHARPRQCGVPQLKYTGLGLLAAEARRSDTRTRRTARLGQCRSWSRSFFTSAIDGCCRSCCLLPVALGIAAGGVLTHVFFGDVNLLAVAFACILVDEGSDYASYLLTQARPGQPLGAEARRIWPTLRLAVLTSTAAFAVLLLAQFRGLQQLGLAVRCRTAGRGHGRAMAAAGPARSCQYADLVTAAGRAHFADMAELRLGLKAGVNTSRKLLAAVGALLVLSLASPVWDDGVAAINPLPADRIAADRALRSAAGLPLDQGVLLFAGADDEAVLQAQEAWLPALPALQSNGVVETFDLAARYLPSVRTQQQRLAAMPEVAVLRATARTGGAGHCVQCGRV